ncbi:MAG: transposase, partial [Solirubrobacterales bacterium]|nr:transposase [Solirubrobacterales bacterium]
MRATDRQGLLECVWSIMSSGSSARLGRCRGPDGRRPPARFDVAEAPDGQRDAPDHDKQSDDHESGGVEIEAGHAGQLLTTVGQNLDRLTGEAAFAALCGASSIPVSSGKTSRHRLNPGGDRDANRALHLIPVVRLRYCQRTRSYAERRTREGKSKR